MAVANHKKRLQISLRKKVTEKLEEVAQSEGLTKSYLIESALIDYLSNFENKAV